MKLQRAKCTVDITTNINLNLKTYERFFRELSCQQVIVGERVCYGMLSQPPKGFKLTV